MSRENNKINPYNNTTWNNKKGGSPTPSTTKNPVLSQQIENTLWWEMLQKHPVVPINPSLDMKLIIQDRYDHNTENGISYDDFVKDFGQEIVDKLQEAINTLDLWEISRVSHEITTYNPSTIKSHHVRNIATHMQIDVSNFLKRYPEKTNQ